MTPSRLFALIMILLAGCARTTKTAADSNAVTTFDDATHGLRLTYPGDWDDAGDVRPRDAILLLSPPGRSTSMTPAVSVVAGAAASTDLGEIETYVIDRARRETEDFKLLERGPASVAGESARRVVYRGTKLNQSVQVMYILTLHQGQQFAFSLLADPVDFDDVRPAVEAMVASVRWVK